MTPLVVSLEHSPVSAFTEAFNGADTVVFSAGAGGKDGPERTRTVDYEGAVKVFDAIEAVRGKKPHLLHVSAADVRDPDQIPPHWVSIGRRRTVALIHASSIERCRPGCLSPRAAIAQRLFSLEVPS